LRLLVKVRHDDSPNLVSSDSATEQSDPDSAPKEFVPGRSVTATLRLPGVDDFALTTVPVPDLPDTFEVLGAPPGEIFFSDYHRDGNGKSQAQFKKVQVSSDAQFNLVPRGVLVSITGEIPEYKSDQNNPKDSYEQVQIQFTSADGASSYSASIGENGQFELSIPAGQYQVDSTITEGAIISSLESANAAISGRTVTFASNPVKLIVHLVQADCIVTGTALKNGKPFAGAMLLLVPEDSKQSASQFHRDQSDSDGTFTMSQVLPGRYTLLALENGWDLEWSNLSVLFPFLSNGVPLNVKSASSVSATVKVQ
jgi:hypothetical protein